MKRIYALVCFALFTINAFSQQSLTEFYYSKIEAKPGEIIVSVKDSVYCDTLILGDYSGIVFTLNSIFIVKNAFIGNKCSLLSGTKPSVNDMDGYNGFDLYLSIFFRKLGGLTINTSGGFGRSGQDGMPGDYGGDSGDGGDGGNGGDGGKGGDGGNITLYYGFETDPPIFNGTGLNSILLNNSKGKGGEGGNGGRGGRGGRSISQTNRITFRDGRSGSPGVTGSSGKAGKLVLMRIPN